MRNIYTKLVEMYKNGRSAVLATIIKQAGPSPRGIGTKCLILDDGSFTGTKAAVSWRLKHSRKPEKSLKRVFLFASSSP